jgi:propanediol dehydratase small subunit
MSEYPLIEKAADTLRTPTGKKLDEITLEAMATGDVTIDDLRVSAEALELQAGFAEKANRPQLAENLRRAAELVDVPEERILEIYRALRPGGATRESLLELAGELEQQGKPRNAALVRDAAS